MGDEPVPGALDALESLRGLTADVRLVTNTTLKPRRSAEGLVLDVGAYAAALEYGAGVDPVVVGKPSQRFFESALEQIEVGPGSALMVDDDVEADVGGALDAGLEGVLVRTGKYRADTVRASGIEPTATIESIADLPDLLASREA